MLKSFPFAYLHNNWRGVARDAEDHFKRQEKDEIEMQFIVQTILIV